MVTLLKNTPPFVSPSLFLIFIFIFIIYGVRCRCNFTNVYKLYNNHRKEYLPRFWLFSFEMFLFSQYKSPQARMNI